MKPKWLILLWMLATAVPASDVIDAANKGDVAKLKELIKADPDCVNCKDGEMTPLFAATQWGKTEAVKLLLESGADANVAVNGQTPFTVAVSGADEATAEVLAPKTKDHNPILKPGSSLFHIAAIGEHNERMLKFLVSLGVPLECKDAFGYSPLRHAVMMNRVENIKQLLECGADIETKDIHGVTPLADACLSGKPSTAIALIELGADVNSKDKFGSTPLHKACLLNDASVVELLIQRKADIAYKGPDDETPLHSAAAMQRLESVRILLKHNAPVNALDEKGRTPLDLVKEESKDLRKLLIESGAKSGKELKK